MPNIFSLPTQFGGAEDDSRDLKDLQCNFKTVVAENFCPRSRAAIPSLQHVQHGSADRVMPCVSDHSGTKTLAPPRQQSEHQAVNPDQQHARTALVAMRCPKNQRRQQNSRQHRTGERRELPLQISAEDDPVSYTHLTLP